MLPLAPTANNPSSRVQQRRAQRFSTSDDSAMMKQVQATHAPDGREVDVKPIIKIVEEILIHSIANTVEGDDGKGEVDSMEKAAVFANFDMLDSLSFVIYKISCELSCKCSGSGDAHATTMVLLNILSNYSWHAKVVLTLAAFAVNFGEFWLVAKLGAANTLAKSVSLLKQLPDLVVNFSSLKPQFDELIKLLKNALDVTRCIVEFQELPSEYISEDTPPMSVASAHIPVATYWTIRSIVDCSSHIASLVGLRNEFITSTTGAWDLSSLADKMSSIYEHLRSQLQVFWSVSSATTKLSSKQTRNTTVDQIPHEQQRKIGRRRRQTVGLPPPTKPEDPSSCTALHSKRVTLNGIRWL